MQIHVPATGGYLNLGESMIYTAAVVTSPLVAGIAGGVGAALADIVTGYAIFAPGTLIIKFVEGVVVGFLFRKLMKYKNLATLFGIIFGSAISLLIIYIGSQGVEITLGFIGSEYVLLIPPVLWMIIGFIAFILIAIVAGLIAKKGRGIEILSMIVGGTLMVIGYFIYEYFVSNPLTGRPPIAAIVEIPGNFSQMTLGILIALLLVEFIEKASRR